MVGIQMPTLFASSHGNNNNLSNCNKSEFFQNHFRFRWTRNPVLKIRKSGFCRDPRKLGSKLWPGLPKVRSSQICPPGIRVGLRKRKLTTGCKKIQSVTPRLSVIHSTTGMPDNLLEKWPNMLKKSQDLSYFYDLYICIKFDRNAHLKGLGPSTESRALNLHFTIAAKYYPQGQIWLLCWISIIDKLLQFLTYLVWFSYLPDKNYLPVTRL